MKSEVCIILVNFKGHHDTIECLESLLKSSFHNFKIVVVDNSPTDESIDAMMAWARGPWTEIKTKFPQFVEPQVPKPIVVQLLSENESLAVNSFKETLTIVKANENRGFAAGNNIALRMALRQDDIKYVWLLNNDTIVEPQTMQTLVAFAGNTTAGMIGSKLLYYNDPTTVQAMGGRYNSWFGKGREIGAGRPDSKEWDTSPSSMDYIIGASMFVKKECIADIGLMDENWFLYFEELDWAIRARKKNWSLAYCPARVYHKVGASTKGSGKSNSRTADFYFARNKILNALRYYPWTLPTLYLGFILFIFKRIRLGQFDRIPMLFGIMMHPSRHIEK